jgi:outer membrane protein OmpA-like peptidoglycan-associated protein
MRQLFLRRLASLGAALAFALSAAFAAAPAVAQELKGIISHYEGDKMTVKSSDGSSHIYTITPSTKVVQVYGRFNMQSKDMTSNDLLEGLAVTVESQNTGSEMAASKITFRDDDYKTAQQVNVGTESAKERARAKAAELEAKDRELAAKDAEMKQRLADANSYVAKAETTVLFASGSVAINKDGKAKLDQLCAQAQSIKGYWIGVTGYADKTGDPQKNQVLSEKRANAVIRYVQKSCNIQPMRVLSGAAMGDVKPISHDESAAGLAQNRRVVAQILVNKGLEGL